MKVINEGKIPEPPKAWWVGQIMKCGKCGWTAELEAGDAHLIKDISERRPGGRRQVGCICPTCADALLQDEVVMRGSSPSNADVMAAADNKTPTKETTL